MKPFCLGKDADARGAYTRELLAYWQAHGLAPNVEGHPLLWMQARRYEYQVFHQERHYGSFSLYVAPHDPWAQYQVGWPYRGQPNCALHVSPRGVLRSYWATGEPTHMLAVRADPECLLAPLTGERTGSILCAARGVPIAAYEIHHGHGWTHHFELVDGPEVLTSLTNVWADEDYEHDSLRYEREGHWELERRHRAFRLALWGHTARDPAFHGKSVQEWQQRGLLPEVEPNRFLVWKHVKLLETTEPTVASENALPTYQGMGTGKYVLNETYFYPNAMVCAGPAGPMKEYLHQDGAQGLVLAILADRDYFLAVPDRKGVFYAFQGTPIAVYQGTRLSAEEFEYQHLDGVDAMKYVQ